VSRRRKEVNRAERENRGIEKKTRGQAEEKVELEGGLWGDGEGWGQEDRSTERVRVESETMSLSSQSRGNTK